MEILGLIVGYFVLAGAYQIIVGLLGSAGRAAKKAITGKETYYGLGQVRIRAEKAGELDSEVRVLEFRGNPVLAEAGEFAFCVWARDATDASMELPLISLIDETREPESTCFYQETLVGRMNPGDTFTDWVRIGVIFPKFLQAPRSGVRKIKVFACLQDTRAPMSIYAGWPRDTDGIKWSNIIEEEIEFSDEGYQEESENREEAQGLTVKIAMAVALADGSLADEEGRSIQEWITRTIAPFSDERRDELKERYNNALKEAYEEGSNGNLSLSPLIDRLGQIGSNKVKFDAIELCLNVMSADGVADTEEMNLIRNIAETLEVDMKEFENLREQATVSLSVTANSQDDLEALIGIQKDWSKERKRTHLREEFQKWSNRLNSLPEGEERDAAQGMLDNIAVLRKELE